MHSKKRMNKANGERLFVKGKKSGCAWHSAKCLFDPLFHKGSSTRFLCYMLRSSTVNFYAGCFVFWLFGAVMVVHAVYNSNPPSPDQTTHFHLFCTHVWYLIMAPYACVSSMCMRVCIYVCVCMYASGLGRHAIPKRILMELRYLFGKQHQLRQKKERNKTPLAVPSLFLFNFFLLLFSAMRA